MLLTRELPLPADPVALARRLEAAGRQHMALLHSAGRASGSEPRVSYVAADPDRCSHALDPAGDDDWPPAPPASVPGGTPRWIGVVPYESRRELERESWCAPERRGPPRCARPEWWRYAAVVRIEHDTGRVSLVGTDRAALSRLEEGLGASPAQPGAVRLDVADDEAPDEHLRRVERALELIARGDLYQVNLARRLRLHLVQGGPLDLYARLATAAPSRFGAVLRLGAGVDVLSCSPELLLRALARGNEEGEGPARAAWPPFGRIHTEPIKGTRPRGRDAAEDARLRDELDADPKERAELSMIVDVERNDLGRVAAVGSVRVASPPHVVTHPGVHHRQAHLVAHSRLDASRREVIEAMVPSGSVTGAPKVRAMEVIRELEAHRRGLYTGGLGYVAHDGSLVLAMAIRTLVLCDRQGEYWTGGGIVADSDPRRELEETRWKAAQLAAVVG
ncbi:MAG: anthranilate synthase component I family protein [Deltaproteobacteria bacterium]|nr:anthranilate synthase component I family protein [Deltaproteobacteria bacterium]